MGLADQTLYGLADALYALGGRLLVIDEVHRYSNWAQEIKNIYDTFGDMRVIISGSSMLNILYEKFDLSRRLVMIAMPTLSFREYFEVRYGIKLQTMTLEEVISRGAMRSQELVLKYPYLYQAFRDYLHRGTYPFFVEGDEHYLDKLVHALEKIIYEDIPSIHRIAFAHLTVLEKLIFRVVTSNEPFMVNMAGLSREVQVSEPTLYLYLSILEKSGIFRLLKKASKKHSKKPNKLLFSNTNILHAYGDKLFVSPKEGIVRETYFVSCFDEIYYSDVGDFVVEDIVFEVGGKNKGFEQIKAIKDAYLALDIDFSTHPHKIPLWIFGLMR
jgi:predicted AAA+ superfamily ATPase